MPGQHRFEFIFAVLSKSACRHRRDKSGLERIVRGIEQGATVHGHAETDAVLANVGLLQVEHYTILESDEPEAEAVIPPIENDRSRRSEIGIGKGLDLLRLQWLDRGGGCRLPRLAQGRLAAFRCGTTVVPDQRVVERAGVGLDRCQCHLCRDLICV